MITVATYPGSFTEDVCRILDCFDADLLPISTLKEVYHTPYDAVLLLGGEDISNSLYLSNTGEPIGERDGIEVTLLHKALKDRLPVLGICRGCQLINVVMNGTLHEDLPTHRYVYHTVRYTKAFRQLSKIQLPDLTNSYHHQGIKKLGIGLLPFAYADSLIEGIIGSKIMGVQWHPELLVSSNQQWLDLFAWFLGNYRHKAKAVRSLVIPNYKYAYEEYDEFLWRSLIDKEVKPKVTRRWEIERR